jgi:2-polyprenyl-3-methyl-5-hydroxy-6-metoxy-1,4-benzoquinol methylase
MPDWHMKHRRQSAALCAATEWDEEHPPCAVCNRYSSAPLVVRNGHQLVRCTHCGLVYVSPRPRNRATVDALYTNDTYSARQVSHALTEGRMREAEWRLDQLERHVPARGRLLDVGCSAGSFLVAARRRGWEVRGIDVSPAAVAHARNVHALDVSVSTLEESAIRWPRPDVITLFECIEHLLDPRATVRAAADRLPPGGLLVITTPNIDGFVPRATYWLLGRTLGAWDHPTPPHHLYQFSLRTLTMLLQQAGFQVVWSGTRPMGLRYTVKQMQSAVVDAVGRRLGRETIRKIGASPARPHAPAPPSPKPLRTRDVLRYAARRALSGFCWTLGVLLYAVPAQLLGVGDSMVVVARRTGPGSVRR